MLQGKLCFTLGNVFLPKKEYDNICVSITLDLNPFDTKPMAKMAVKNEHNEGGEVHVQLR